MAFVGHARTKLLPELAKVIDGANDTLKIVPFPVLPPAEAVPYRMPPNKTKLDCGLAPSRLVPVPKKPEVPEVAEKW